MQAVVKFNYAALHVIETGGIHKELHSLILKLMIPLFFCTKDIPYSKPEQPPASINIRKR